MTRRRLDTILGPVWLRPEQETDHAFLFDLFRGHASGPLDAMPIDQAMKQSLLRMQFASQTTTYRGQYPDAHFDIVEIDGADSGRIVVDDGGDTGCIVDFSLLPVRRGKGLGPAILAAILQRFIPLQRPVRCLVLMHNAASLRMCHRVGFRVVAEAPPFLHLEWRPD